MQDTGPDAVLFGFFNQRTENAAAGSLAFSFGLDHDRANFGEMRTVEVKRSASKKDPGIGLGDGEVAVEGFVLGQDRDPVRGVRRPFLPLGVDRLSTDEQLPMGGR